jgi:hypothetical protein
MFAAITTRFHGPTNSRGSRITATSQAGRLTLPYDHRYNADENHTLAARALAKKLEWRGHWYGGGLPNGRGYAFVCSTRGTSDFAIWEVDGTIVASGETSA